MSTKIVINNLTKRFGNVVAVNNVSLTIAGIVPYASRPVWLWEDHPSALHLRSGRPR
jgi:hypothetical protein